MRWLWEKMWRPPEKKGGRSSHKNSLSRQLWTQLNWNLVKGKQKRKYKNLSYSGPKKFFAEQWICT